MEGTVDTLPPKRERSVSWPLDHRSLRGEAGSGLHSAAVVGGRFDRFSAAAESELKRSQSLPLVLLRSLGHLLCDLARKVSTAARSKKNCPDGSREEEQPVDLPRRQPPVLLRVSSRKRAWRSQYQRQSRTNQFLDIVGPNEDFEYASRPRTYAMRLSDKDGHGRVPRRQQSVCSSYTRSLDDLAQLEDQLETEFPGLRSAKSLYSLSSEEDLSEQIRDEDSPVEDYPITTESDAESTGDELDRVPSMQTAEQVSGDIELVVGFSKQHWCHCDSWKGEVTEDGHMRIYQDESKEREIHLPPENMLLSKETMEEKVCKMTLDSTVYTQPAEL